MTQERFILTVVGKDHPGIVAGIANTLYRYGCNIQELNQTVLSDEFAMILLLQPTKDISIKELDESLRKKCLEMGVNHSLRPATIVDSAPQKPKDIVIITVIGSDKIGIVAGVSEVLANMNINIIELSAKPFIIRNIPQYSVVARVEVEDEFDMLELNRALDDCANRLSIEIRVQSHDIFRAMHEV
jgi:glycine cleavage system transcriptional repressor